MAGGFSNLNNHAVNASKIYVPVRIFGSWLASWYATKGCVSRGRYGASASTEAANSTPYPESIKRHVAASDFYTSLASIESSMQRVERFSWYRVGHVSELVLLVLSPFLILLGLFLDGINVLSPQRGVTVITMIGVVLFALWLFLHVTLTVITFHAKLACVKHSLRRECDRYKDRKPGSLWDLVRMTGGASSGTRSAAARRGAYCVRITLLEEEDNATGMKGTALSQLMQGVNNASRASLQRAGSAHSTSSHTSNAAARPGGAGSNPAGFSTAAPPNNTSRPNVLQLLLDLHRERLEQDSANGTRSAITVSEDGRSSIGGPADAETVLSSRSTVGSSGSSGSTSGLALALVTSSGLPQPRNYTMALPLHQLQAQAADRATGSMTARSESGREPADSELHSSRTIASAGLSQTGTDSGSTTPAAAVDGVSTAASRGPITSDVEPSPSVQRAFRQPSPPTYHRPRSADSIVSIVTSPLAAGAAESTTSANGSAVPSTAGAVNGFSPPQPTRVVPVRMTGSITAARSIVIPSVVTGPISIPVAVRHGSLPSLSMAPRPPVSNGADTVTGEVVLPVLSSTEHHPFGNG